MIAEDFVSRLEQVRPRSGGKWLAKCPAHEDRSPSLSIREHNTCILIRCFSGCTAQEIVSSLGLEMRDLFTDAAVARGQRLVPKPQKLDLVSVAFRFELAALDRRLRADATIRAVEKINGEDLDGDGRDQLLRAVARAYEDRNRAEFLEAVADDFRLKAFHERIESNAA